MVSGNYYLDSSALLKKYFREKGSDEVREVFGAESALLTASITYAEVYCAHYRRMREGHLTEAEANDRLREFETDWTDLFQVTEFSASVRMLLPEMIRHVPLRGADAIHLATAMSFKSRGLDPVFVSSDLRLINAAKSRGFKVKNPERK